MISNAYYLIIDRLDCWWINRWAWKTTTTKNLYALSDLETGMVYSGRKNTMDARTYCKVACHLSGWMMLKKLQFGLLSWSKACCAGFGYRVDFNVSCNSCCGSTTISQTTPWMTTSDNPRTIFGLVGGLWRYITGFWMNIPLLRWQRIPMLIYVSVCSFILWLIFGKGYAVDCETKSKKEAGEIWASLVSRIIWEIGTI